MPAPSTEQHRYELRLTWRYIRTMFIVAGFALIASLVYSLLTGDFEVLASVGLVVGVLLPLFGLGVRNTFYVILDESQVHIREWRVGARVPYASIDRIELNTEKGQVTIHYHPPLQNGGHAAYTIYYRFSPRDPEFLVAEIQRHVEASSEAPSS